MITPDQAVQAIRHVAQEHGDEHTILGEAAQRAGVVWFGQMLNWQWPPSYLQVMEKNDGVLVRDAIVYSFLQSFECFLFLHDPWQQLAFWPVATDGSGNYYALAVGQRDSDGECRVVFFDMMESREEPVETYASSYADFVYKRMAKQCESLGCSGLN